MKPFTLFSLLTLIVPLSLTAQSQNVIIDDVYFNPSDPAMVQTMKKSGKQIIDNKSRPNYKNGAQEIVYKERTIKYPTIITDTIFVDGKSPDGYAFHTNNKFDIKSYDGHTNPVYVHDTIYSEGVSVLDSININQSDGYYINGFKGDESDKEYAERIRRFHNPKYTIFIGDPRYNDIFFLNNYDWNVYVDGSYAYVTPTWTNPYWWNYNFSPYSWGYGGWGHGWNYGYGGMYSPWWGYDSFYGYGGMYGYGNYWDPYGYYGYGGMYGHGGNYGYGYGYGGYYGGLTSRNKNYDETTRRSSSNYTTDRNSRLGGTRTESASGASTINSGGLITSRNQYTILSGSGTNNGAVTRSISATRTGTRIISNPANGIGLVRNTTNRGFGNSTNSSSNSSVNVTSRPSGSTINTSPRTYTATSTSVPTGNYPSRDGSSVSSFRNSSPTVTRSETGTTTVAPSRRSYSSENSSSSVSRSSSPSYSTGNSSSFSTGGSSSSSSSSSGGSGSSGGGGRSAGSSGGGGRR